MFLRCFLFLCICLSAHAVDDHRPQAALFALNRLGYGPGVGDVARVSQQGVRAWLQAQLHPASVVLPTPLAEHFSALEARQREAINRLDELAALGQVSDRNREQRQILRREIFRDIAEADLDARLQRAVLSPRQLEELLTEFWFNHFNVYSGKAEVRALAGAYEREAIRPHVLGRFRDLLGATARHPAMLFYLDNWQSVASGSRRNQSGGLNENYARELMELHSFGVDGGYTQQDVTELARMFTGWSYERRNLAAGPAAAFRFVQRWHDSGGKRWLGQNISQRGEAEGEYALDVLASAPATAAHISLQLAQFFVSDTPSPALVQRMAQRFKASDGDIRAVLETLFESDEFWQAVPRFKTPYRYVISALRLQGVEQPPLRAVQGTLQQMGQAIYAWPTPDGYKASEAAWLNPLAIQKRVDFATQLGLGRLASGSASAASASQMQAEIAPLLGANTRQILNDQSTALQAALLLGSPEFMRY
ncbi:DUF1800 domain-containing protein [Iodobacter sp. LRB]|uniref:DUF1800 domain-containing protein n=1 Tax=unclassified Iodobacter TaxID=235634 RepID=UPI0015D4B23F|nr:DUF1800 domain-containing protein [Iodobacter sp. BJB302]